VTVSGARRSLDERFHTAADHDPGTYTTHQWLPLHGGNMEHRFWIPLSSKPAVEACSSGQDCAARAR
jgi:hypothetical protein